MDAKLNLFTDTHIFWVLIAHKLRIYYLYTSTNETLNM